jgi:hypothetical protein
LPRKVRKAILALTFLPANFANVHEPLVSVKKNKVFRPAPGRKVLLKKITEHIL